MSTAIEWTDETWNPVTGCTPISEGCQNCYAQRMANRLKGRCGYDADEPFRPGTLHPDKLDKPLGWREPRKVFVCSMGDLFHEDVTFRDIALVFNSMVSGHIYQVLTKRAARMLEFVEWLKQRYDHSEPWLRALGEWMQELGQLPPNVWLGVTAENQARFDERAEIMWHVPAAVTFVSVEPMLGPVDMTGNLHAIDWVICGAETGPGARPMDPAWAIDLRDQCSVAGVPFFMKKMSGGKQPPDDLAIREFPEVPRG